MRGAANAIPPNTELTFQIEVIKAQPVGSALSADSPDALQPSSRWLEQQRPGGGPDGIPIIFIVIERKKSSFRAELERHNGVQLWLVDGTIGNGEISWNVADMKKKKGVAGNPTTDRDVDPSLMAFLERRHELIEITTRFD